MSKLCLGIYIMGGGIMGLEKKLNDLFVKAFTSNPCPMAISEISSGKYLIVNEALLKLLGYKSLEVIGKTTMELGIFVDYDDRRKAVELMQKQGYLRDFETPIRCKNGSIISGSFNAEFIELNNTTYLLTVMNDLTAKRQLENEVKRLEKNNLLGELASGMSHEVRNPLTTVRGFLQLLTAKSDLIHYKEHFELMLSELDRANSIITDYLSLSKSDLGTNEFTHKNLNNVINKLKPLLEIEALEKNSIILFDYSDVPDIVINEKEIRQVLLNLVRNGLEAMPEGGNLSIKTFRRQDHVVLSIEDQGTGIDQSIVDKLGTPFVTTKNSGTGLGLAVCYAIAHRHNAKIKVTTGSDGTAFFFYFPIPISC